MSILTTNETEIIKHCVRAVGDRTIIALYVSRRIIIVEDMVLNVFHLALIWFGIRIKS